LIYFFILMIVSFGNCCLASFVFLFFWLIYSFDSSFSCQPFFGWILLSAFDIYFCFDACFFYQMIFAFLNLFPFNYCFFCQLFVGIT
jgi:hypothetical protein